MTKTTKLVLTFVVTLVVITVAAYITHFSVLGAIVWAMFWIGLVTWIAVAGWRDIKDISRWLVKQAKRAWRQSP
jgi:hypothetical protein